MEREITYDYERLAKARDERKMSLRDVAERLDLSYMTIQRAENGGSVHERTLRRIATFYGIPYKDIVLDNPIQV